MNSGIFIKDFEIVGLIIRHYMAYVYLNTRSNSFCKLLIALFIQTKYFPFNNLLDDDDNRLYL